MHNIEKKINFFPYDTVIGKIAIAEKNRSITNVYFETDSIPHDLNLCETDGIKEAATQLNQYLNGTLKVFSLPISPEGTSFMQSVWSALGRIPYGETVSYKTIASAIGKPKAVRAVGMANNKNPIPIFIPCHRVIGTNGKLTGYRGGLELKKKLIDMEAKNG
jgi:methylated-DNA-[protein]-cysteine S-methyltransferase